MGRKSKRKLVKEFDGLSKSSRREVQNLCSQLLDLCKTPTKLTPAKQWEEYQQIHAIVEMIRSKQQGIQLFDDESRDDKLEAFFTWIKDNGAECSKVNISNYGTEGYGLQATSNVQKDEVFLTIPRSTMITVETVRQSELGKLAETDPILKTMPNVLLAVHILNEKFKEDSFWKPYLDFLPHSYSVPLYFNSEELSYLQGSPAYCESMKQYKHIARQYAYFNKLFYTNPDVADIPLKNKFTYDGYRWAVSTVMTRQNQIPSSKPVNMCATLIPLWDMCNHTNGKIQTEYDLSVNCSRSLALQNLNPGDQVFIYYGKRTNMEFLIHNGFVFADNENDGVTIQLGISKTEKLFERKMQILKMLSLNSVDSYIVRGGDNPVSEALLAFLRVFCMTEDELNVRFKFERKQEMLELLLKRTLPVSKTNEIKMWTFLETRLGLLLKLYKSTMEEDVALLEKTDISDFKKLAIYLRLGEKKILHDAINHAKKSKEMAEAWDESALPDPLGNPKDNISPTTNCDSESSSDRSQPVTQSTDETLEKSTNCSHLSGNNLERFGEINVNDGQS